MWREEITSFEFRAKGEYANICVVHVRQTLNLRQFARIRISLMDSFIFLFKALVKILILFLIANKTGVRTDKGKR